MGGNWGPRGSTPSEWHVRDHRGRTSSQKSHATPSTHSVDNEESLRPASVLGEGNWTPALDVGVPPGWKPMWEGAGSVDAAGAGRGSSACSGLWPLGVTGAEEWPVLQRERNLTEAAWQGQEGPGTGPLQGRSGAWVPSLAAGPVSGHVGAAPCPQFGKGWRKSRVFTPYMTGPRECHFRGRVWEGGGKGAFTDT